MDNTKIGEMNHSEKRGQRQKYKEEYKVYQGY